MAILTTVNRVPAHTAQKWNQKIEQQAERNIAYYATHTEEIDARLDELEREWDIERMLEANAATVSMASVLFGLLFSRRWLLLPAIVGGFLLQHSVQGWCPPLPVLRRIGIRTQTEIERERYALKALRGDFSQIKSADKAGINAMQIAQHAIKAVK